MKEVYFFLRFEKVKGYDTISRLQLFNQCVMAVTIFQDSDFAEKESYEYAEKKL